jgi:hypothetical protein
MDYRILNYNNIILLESLYIYICSFYYRSNRSRTRYPTSCYPDRTIELVAGVLVPSVFQYLLYFVVQRKHFCIY